MYGESPGIMVDLARNIGATVSVNGFEYIKGKKWEQ